MKKIEKEIIDKLIIYIKENTKTLEKEDFEDYDKNIKIDCLDYYDFVDFVKKLQKEYLSHVNPREYPLWNKYA